MITYNFQRIFRARNIDNPYRLLKQSGFTHNLAHRIAANKINALSLRHLEKFCLLLNCTPHDLMDWQPEKEKSGKDNLSLSILLPENKQVQAVDITAFVRNMPLQQLNELAKALAELKSSPPSAGL